MSPEMTAPRRRRGSPDELPPAPTDPSVIPSRIEATIAAGVSSMASEMAELMALSRPTTEDRDRMMVIADKSSEILGRYNRARAADVRGKLTMVVIERGIANDLSPDERASLIDRLVAGNGGGSVLS